jgi:hypothetical protein
LEFRGTIGGNSWPRGHEAARLPASTGPGHRTEGTFRNSLLENLRELARRPPVFNLTGDPILANISERINAELCTYDADDLRGRGSGAPETKPLDLACPRRRIGAS